MLVCMRTASGRLYTNLWCCLSQGSGWETEGDEGLAVPSSVLSSVCVCHLKIRNKIAMGFHGDQFEGQYSLGCTSSCVLLKENNYSTL